MTWTQPAAGGGGGGCGGGSGHAGGTRPGDGKAVVALDLLGCPTEY